MHVHACVCTACASIAGGMGKVKQEPRVRPLPASVSQLKGCDPGLEGKGMGEGMGRVVGTRTPPMCQMAWTQGVWRMPPVPQFPHVPCFWVPPCPPPHTQALWGLEGGQGSYCNVCSSHPTLAWAPSHQPLPSSQRPWGWEYVFPKRPPPAPTSH